METGKTKEWIEMDGESFYGFLASDEAGGRRFVRIANNGDDECDVIYMEASDKDFRNWKANDNHQRYYRKYSRGRGYKKVSMSAHADEDGLLVEEVVASGDEMTEELAIRGLQVETLYHAMDLLSNAERFWICITGKAWDSRRLQRPLIHPSRTSGSASGGSIRSWRDS